MLTILNHKGESLTFESSNLITFEHEGLEIAFTPRFIYDLLFKRDQEAFDLLTKSTTDDFISSGK